MHMDIQVPNHSLVCATLTFIDCHMDHSCAVVVYCDFKECNMIHLNKKNLLFSL